MANELIEPDKPGSPGTLYLIPVPIAEVALSTLPPSTIEVLHSLEYFVVERATDGEAFRKRHQTAPSGERVDFY